MKKNLVMAVVAVMAVGQAANAGKGSGSDPKGEAPGARAARTEVSKGKAVEAARTGPEVAKSTIEQLKAEGLVTATRLNAEQLKNLEMNLANADVATAVKEAIANSKQAHLKDMTIEVIRALANVNVVAKDSANPFKTAEQKAEAEAVEAYNILALFASKEAAGWSPELRGNLTFLLKTANDILDRGATSDKNVAEAMKEAQRITAKEKGVVLDLAAVKAKCGKKA